MVRNANPCQSLLPTDEDHAAARSPAVCITELGLASLCAAEAGSIAARLRPGPHLCTHCTHGPSCQGLEA